LIRKGCKSDKKRIMNIIGDAVVHMDETGIYQWDSIYPNGEVIEDDLGSGTLYVYLYNEDIKGIIVLNEHQDREYEDIHWSFREGKQLVVHRLCIDPKFQGLGVARQLMSFAEEYAKQHHYNAIRLDAFSENPRACKLYEQLGFIKAGTTRFRKGIFYCFEKKM
jgi:ribosomal protein S18 acetylase RimI-like enzyme